MGASTAPTRWLEPTAASRPLSSSEVPGPAALSTTAESGIASEKMNRPLKNVSDRTQSRVGLKSAPNLRVWRLVMRMKF